MGIRKEYTPPVIDVYARLSFAANGDTINVEDQEEMGRESIEARGGVVGQVFPDNSLSAWKPKVVRPQWNQMMARLESGQSDGVWVLDLTRFSRKILEGERLVELAARGIRVWSRSGEYDLTTADGRRHFREAMVAAAGESDKISERVKRGKLRRARMGRAHGGSRAYGMPGYLPKPDGWLPGDPRTPVPDEVVATERDVIRDVYNRLLGGEGVSTVVKDLQSKGIRGGYGSELSRRSLARMVQRADIAGLVIHNGEILGELVGVDPIVSREEWERMCALMDSRKTGRQPTDVHPMSGTVRCGLCGKMLTGNPRPHLPTYPDGSVRREYRCAKQAGRTGCGKNHIDALTVEEAVDEAMRTRLGDPRRAAKMAAHLSKLSERRNKIEAEISRLNESADELAGKTASWTVARVDKSMQPILKRMGELQTELAGLESPDHADAAADDAVAAWDDARSRHDLPAMRTMVRRAFPLLTLDPQRHFNDHGVDRLQWDPNTPPPPRPRKIKPSTRRLR